MKGNCLLIGNGLNRIGNNEVEWGNVLKSVVEAINEEHSANHTFKIDLSILKEQSYSFQYEYIVNYINNVDCNGKDTYTQVKEKFVNTINKSLKPLDERICKIINAIDLKYIITTNYDVNLERSLCGLNKYEIPYEISKKNKDLKYLFNRTNKYNFAIRGKDIFHMHGIESNPSSICLGFEHYAGMVNQLRDKLSGTDYISLKDDKREKPHIIEYLEKAMTKDFDFSSEFETKFFENNLSIIGLALSSEEIDIWWLLIFRAYLYFANIEDAKNIINNTIKYYDIVDKSKFRWPFKKKKLDEYLNQQTELYNKMHVTYEPTIIDTWGISEEEKTNLYIQILEKVKKDYDSNCNL